MRISDLSSDVCSSDLPPRRKHRQRRRALPRSRDDRADGARPRTGARGRGELDASARAHRHLALYPHPADGRADDRALSRRAGGSVADRRVHLFATRSEEHTSELQSLMRISYAVFCLKKKKKDKTTRSIESHTNHTH